MAQSFAKSAFCIKIASVFEIAMALYSSSIASHSSSQNFTDDVEVGGWSSPGWLDLTSRVSLASIVDGSQVHMWEGWDRGGLNGLKL